ncbi:group III truncated hemoglobin [Conservatibacter flavescens]|uniref:Globin n=1 Tax=Conservatibacter flavescens TaxID=28161 RepID=A0A2M8S4H2_9PAST|nr:group III truncated hemoglobin [Conservatibacter flavescens]PJG86046.1 globin [Conservatibacter flavescens]
MKKDIESRADIELLVQEFYKVVRQDPEIGYIFDYIVENRWEKHLDKMYRFWSSLLLAENSYDGNPMLKHIKLHERIPLTYRHFDVWLQIWTNTVNTHFTGLVAQEAIFRGTMIKEMMSSRVISEDLPEFIKQRAMGI